MPAATIVTVITNGFLSQKPDLRVPLGEMKAQATAASDGAVTLEIAERDHILRAVRDVNGMIEGPAAPPPASA